MSHDTSNLVAGVVVGAFWGYVIGLQCGMWIARRNSRRGL
jgi:uncharacterized membrane protein